MAVRKTPAPPESAKPRKRAVPERSAPEPVDDSMRQRDSASRAEAYRNFTDDLSLLLDA